MLTCIYAGGNFSVSYIIMLYTGLEASSTPILTNGRDDLDADEDGCRQGRPPKTHRPRTCAVDTGLSNRDGDEVVEKDRPENRR